MDERTQVHVTLADGTEFDAVSDGAGNLIVTGGIEKSVLNQANLSEVQLDAEVGGISNLKHQALRTFYDQADGSTFIRFGDMTDTEMLAVHYDAKLEYLAMMTDVDMDEEV